MHIRSFIPVLGAALLVTATFSCTTRANYLDIAGPRYALDTSVSLGPTQRLKVVSYNVQYGEHVDAAIETLLGTPELADGDVFLLQEMHAPGVDRIARALGCSYVYYPASLRSSGREFGNAVLTRGRIVEDEKVLLPHVNPINRQSRIAVRTDLELGQRELHAYSVHTETPVLSIRDRMEQIETLLSSVPDGSAPCLIAGDFNTMGKRSREGFEGAFARNGFDCASSNIGSTFEIGPIGYSLDHVFVRGMKVIDSGKVEAAAASDHIPIWVELVWMDEPES